MSQCDMPAQCRLHAPYILTLTRTPFNRFDASQQGHLQVREGLHALWHRCRGDGGLQEFNKFNLARQPAVLLS